MRRVSRKSRPVGSKRQLEHYVFGSPRHRADKAMADRLRGTEILKTATILSKVASFPRAEALAGNFALVTQDGKVGWKRTPDKTYIEVLKPYLKKGAGEYQIPMVVRGQIRRKKNGDIVMQKKHTKAMRDVYISLPPWISEALAGMMSQEAAIPKIRRLVEVAASKAVEVLEKRTGYKPVGIAIHPDSRHAIGIHIQYLTVENGQLLGRSREGTKGEKDKPGVGRRGLRLAGDVNCALHRFNKVRPVEGDWIKSVSTRDYDDIAMHDAMDAAISTMAPNMDFGKEDYVDDWLKRRKQAIDAGRSKDEKLEDTRVELEKSQLEAARLRTRVAALEKGLYATTLKKAPVSGVSGPMLPKLPKLPSGPPDHQM